MFALKAADAALSWVGRQGTRAIATLVFMGIALPWVGALLKPFVTEAVFALLCTAFLRVDLSGLQAYLRRPVVVLAATAWTSLLAPALLGLIYLLLGFKEHSPELFLALMLQAIASPMMAAPALATLMGLDATLVLVTLILSTAMIPITVPLFSYALIGQGMMPPPIELGVKLLAMLAGSALVGLSVRKAVGPAVVDRCKERINGFNILALFVFMAAIMQNVAAHFIDRPMAILRLSLLAFVVFSALLCLTVLLFARAGRARALALGFMASQRNMGLMLAAAGGALPDLVWLYFALSQFPIYLSPQLLRPLVRRMVATARNTPDFSPFS